MNCQRSKSRMSNQKLGHKIVVSVDFLNIKRVTLWKDRQRLNVLVFIFQFYCKIIAFVAPIQFLFVITFLFSVYLSGDKKNFFICFSENDYFCYSNIQFTANFFMTNFWVLNLAVRLPRFIFLVFTFLTQFCPWVRLFVKFIKLMFRDVFRTLSNI